jgi:hypothetical protein
MGSVTVMSQIRAIVISNLRHRLLQRSRNPALDLSRASFYGMPDVLILASVTANACDTRKNLLPVKQTC